MSGGPPTKDYKRFPEPTNYAPDGAEAVDELLLSLKGQPERQAELRKAIEKNKKDMVDIHEYNLRLMFTMPGSSSIPQSMNDRKLVTITFDGKVLHFRFYDDKGRVFIYDDEESRIDGDDTAPSPRVLTDDGQAVEFGKDLDERSRKTASGQARKLEDLRRLSPA